ncbi:MAG: alpha/beta hydrolase [Armatimonadetes bacterium]|nr:alpha/beta hydrolase [Armatimonadota bacterium]
MSNYEELTLDILGVKTCVRKGGSGPPLVYWHGAGGGGAWHAHHALLAERFTVYAPDHPGWSDSDNPEWMDAMLDYALHYDSLFRLLNIERPTLVGHSLGGWMAATFAAIYPTRLARLVLVNAAGYPFITEEQPDFFAAAMRGGKAFSKALFHNPEIAKTYMPANPTPEEQMLRFRHMTSTARLAWHCWFDEKMPQRLARLQVPTLVLWGAHDGLFPPILAEKYAAAIPNSRLVILPECAHMVPFEDKEALLREILELPEAPLS